MPSDNPAILKVQCPGCSTVYNIKKAKITSFPAAFTCKKCSERIRIEAPPGPPPISVSEPVPPAPKTQPKAAPPPIQRVSPAEPAGNGAPTGQNELALFIGNNASLYLDRFKKFTAFGSSQFVATWHWPAFFFPFPWLLYRKLYLWSLLALVLAFIPVVNWGASIAWAITAHYLYFKHTHKKIEECKARFRLSPNPPLDLMLQRSGGVNHWFWVAAIIPALGIIAAIAVPQFVSYRARAFDNQAKSAVQEVMNAEEVYYQQNNQYADSIEQLQEAGLSPPEGPGLVVSLLGSGSNDFYVEGVHARGSKRFGAGSADGGVTVLPNRFKEVFSPDRAYELAVPDGWQRTNKLNAAAQVQIAQPRKHCYLIVISENRENIPIVNLENYSVLARNNIQDHLLQPVVQKTGLDSIDHLPVVQYEIRGTLPDNRVPVVYLLTAVQGQNSFYQVLAWTDGENYQQNKAIMRSIVSHFKEV
jgi:Tfp pilus assembly protein PilE